MFNFIKNITSYKPALSKFEGLHVTRSKGFTLVEMLVVVTIIGILAGVVMVSANSARIEGRDTKRKADLEATAAALELYYSQEKAYPINSAWIKLDDIKSSLSKYIGTWPSDPIAQPGGNCSGYCYITDSNGAKFILDVVLEKKESGDACDDTSFESTTCVANGDSHYRVAGK